jgi:hypothetical protein
MTDPLLGQMTQSVASSATRFGLHSRLALSINDRQAADPIGHQIRLAASSVEVSGIVVMTSMAVDPPCLLKTGMSLGVMTSDILPTS